MQIKYFPFGAFQENTYLVFDETSKHALLFDPGFSDENEEQLLLDFIATRDLTISGILLTHAHIDHVVGLKKSVERWAKKPMLHINEASVFKQSEVAAAMYHIPYQAYTGEIQWLDHATRELSTALGTIQLLHTPGHSPGSVCFYFTSEASIIGGDVLFLGSIGRSDLPGGDFDTLIHSIQTELFTLPDEVKVYPGHGTPTSIGYEKKHNPFLQND